jgi:hypothetical protein
MRLSAVCDCDEEVRTRRNFLASVIVIVACLTGGLVCVGKWKVSKLLLSDLQGHGLSFPLSPTPETMILVDILGVIYDVLQEV